MAEELVIAADLHLAQIWDAVAAAVPDEHRFLNPNRYWETLVDRVDDGQTLVVNGDFVDYQSAAYDGEDRANWERVMEPLTGRDIDLFGVPGNHDYRVQPYNLDLKGLDHVNIPRTLWREIRDEVGHTRFRGFGERDALHVPREEQGKRSTPQSTQHGSAELVLLDTGPDVLADPGWRGLFEQVTFLLEPRVQVAGLTDEHVRYVETRLENGDAEEYVFFMHAPPFFSVEPCDTATISMDAYYTSVAQNGVDDKIFRQNNDAFMELLLDSGENCTVIASHTHQPKQYLLHKETQTIQETSLADINAERGNEQYIKLVTTPPLGAIRNDYRRIGYLTMDETTIQHHTLDYFADAEQLPTDAAITY